MAAVMVAAACSKPKHTVASKSALTTTSSIDAPVTAPPTTTDQVTSENNESINLMVKYWNDHAFDAAAYAPAVRSLMGNDNAHQFYGRKLVGNIIDGGSNQCPDKTSSAAIKAAQVDKAMAVFNNLEGASPAGAYNMAADLNAQGSGNSACVTGVRGCPRPMHFGSLWLSDQDYARFAPFSWTQFATGSTITRQWASYICARVVGHTASRSPDAATAAKPRVFGFVHTNLDQDVRLANEFKSYLKADCGRDIIAKEVSYDGTNFAQAQQDDPNLMLQLSTAGVTSVLMMTEPVQPLIMLNDAKAQNFKPEWIWSSFGYADSNTVQRLYDQTETAGSFGTTNLGVTGGFGFGAGDPFTMYHTYHMVAPDGKPCDPTSDAGMDHGDRSLSGFGGDFG